MQHHRPLTEWQIAELFAEAYASAATMKNAQKGFTACGVHPFDPNKFQAEDFMAIDSDQLNLQQHLLVTGLVRLIW